MKRQRKTALLVLLCLCVLIGTVCGFLGYEMKRGARLSEETPVTIPSGAGTAEVAAILEEGNIIRYPLVFQIAAKWQGLDGQWQKGTISVEPGQDYDDLFRLLTTPQTASVKVTIPEGKQAKQIGAILEEAGICSAEDFLNASTYGVYDYDFLEGVSYQDRISGLEGYLFPDTYFFEPDADGEDVVHAMLQRFQELVVTEEILTRAEEIGYTLDEVVILGSMVESEATTTEDRKLVAGVFLNRLAHPDLFPRLQSCVTVEYAMGIKKQVLSLEDTKYDSPYKTYQNPGLPYGPICCPSLESIEAVLWSTESNYYYFQSDDKGKLHFAETFEEHAAIQEELHANWGS